MSLLLRDSTGRKSHSGRKSIMLIADQLSLAATYETGPPGHIRSGREPAAERSKTARSRSPRSSPFYTSIVTARWRGHALARRANLARTQPCNGSARGASRPHAQHPARIVRAVRAELGLQQREHHQVELCAATADAFEFAGNRFKRVDRGGEISPFESGEGVRHRRNEGAGWITTLARELVDLPCARLQRRVIASHDLCQHDVHVGKGHAGARKRAVREVVHHAPCFGVARMPGEFPAPQKGNRIVHLPARRSAVYIGCEGFPEKPERCRRIAGLEVAKCQMPTQVAI